MGGMNQTPASERVHIGFFGKRNAGKSSVMNKVTGQNLAVVSDVKGTTTDPLNKAMELIPLGPVVMMDTPGIDDEGELGSLRVKKSYQVLNKTDAAVLVIDGKNGMSQEDQALLERIKKKNPNTVFHVDAIQAFGKLSICPKKLNIDLMSVSGHKFHGPKGIGMLYVREKTKIRPLILGGGQQNGMRSGTDNVPGAAGMALAAQMVCDHLEENRAHMYRIREQLVSGLGNMDRVIVHGKQGEQAAPQIVNASFLGVRSEVLLHTLENEGIYVSAGSACSSHKRGGSPTLTAIGASKEERESAVRFSFSEWTTEEEIEKTLEVLNRVVPVLRKFTRK